MPRSGRPLSTYAIPYLDALEASGGGWLSFAFKDNEGEKIARWIRRHRKDVAVSYYQSEGYHWLFLRNRD